MKRFTYRVQIAYDGTAFAAFAPVPGERTVWSALRAALIAVAPGFGHLASGGRTDRGASATGQVISFISRDLVELDRIAQAIDEAVPGALAALEMRRVPDKFHAQFSACFRRYVYFHPDDGTYDARRIDAMLGALVGRRDFRAFARDTPLGKKTEKTLYEASARRVLQEGVPYLRFDFAGDAFLRKQVRVMVATALRESLVRSDPEALVALARAGDRRATPLPAAAEGLVLTKIGYEPIGRSPLG
jgi:tRNA pseudouridine38-40 synthase